VPNQRLFSGQSTEHDAHLLELALLLPMSLQEHLPLPIRMARMAKMTIARTIKSTMTVGRFMR
jgi:hypothetical protein